MKGGPELSRAIASMRALQGSGTLAGLAAVIIAAEAAAQQGGTAPVGAPGESFTLRTIEVTGTAESAFGPVLGYSAERSATATRTDTPIRETPVSIQVVPRDVIIDQAPRRLRDLYRNVSGVTPDFTGGNVSATEVPIIRGFQDFTIYRNGFRAGQLAPLDFANVERVEVLKGPASVLFGLSEPGGIINIVTKRPQPEAFATATQEIGSYRGLDSGRVTFDVNRPLSADGRLLGRLNAAVTSDATFRDHDGVDRIFVAPSLAWRPSDRTEFVADVSYSYEKYPFDHGLAFSPDGEPVADVSTFLGEPGFRSERHEVFAGYTLTHDVNASLTLRNAFSFQYNENRLNSFRHFGSTNPDFTVNRSLDRSVPKGMILQTTADLTYRFGLGATMHTVLAGVDLRWEPEPFNQQDGPRSSGPFPIDIVDPVYGAFGPVVFDNPTDFDSETRWLGLYLQDQVRLLDDRLHLLVGGRFDYVYQDVKFITPTFAFEGDRSETAFTGRIGALYDLTDWLSPYVNISQSFAPVSPFTVGDLDPEEGLQYEAGVKLGFLDDRLTSTVALYHITKDNVPVTDPDNPDFSINGGELRSRGVEVDVAGEIMPGWQVIANYAYTDTEVRESDFLPVGSRFRNVPEHSAGLWTSYDFQPGSRLEGFGVGLGGTAQSDRLGDDAGSFELDGFGVVDAALWYRGTFRSGGLETPFRAQVNVQNLLDKEYYENSSGTASVFPGAPRGVFASLSLDF